ncbi:MAG: GGDEF domain-containing protein [Myxococcaceae bacterium]
MSEKRKKLPAGTDAKVLLADPDPVQLEEASKLLRAGGLRVAALSRPEAAGPLFKAFVPDVLVMATRAPQMHGVEIGRKLLRMAKGALPIIYIIDAPDPELRSYCLIRGYGVDAVSRPLRTDELAQRVIAQARLRESFQRESRRVGAYESSSQIQDKATGVYNRAFVSAVLSHELRRGERHGDGCALLLTELNNFPEIKRRFGREIAERLLVYSSLVLRQSVRESDVVGRVGEAQFGMVLPRTRHEDLRTIRRRIQTRFQAARFQLGGYVFRPSVSLGAASFPEVVGGAHALFALADVELKRSRAGHSDRVTGMTG